MNISKIIFFLVVCIVNANTHVWAQNDALKVYDLKGNPSMASFSLIQVVFRFIDR